MDGVKSLPSGVLPQGPRPVHTSQPESRNILLGRSFPHFGSLTGRKGALQLLPAAPAAGVHTEEALLQTVA